VACGAGEGVARFHRLTVKLLTVKASHFCFCDFFFDFSLVPTPEPSQAQSRDKEG
jgi:hypothetical protein